MPPAMLAYKSLTHHTETLLAYLECAGMSSPPAPSRSGGRGWAPYAASQRQEKRSMPGCFSPSEVTWKPKAR